MMITKSAVQDILDNTIPKDDTTYPFPQANTVSRIFNLIAWMKHREKVLGSCEVTHTEIEDHWNFTDVHDGDRQGKYYADAANYLGFTLPASDESIKLSPLGQQVTLMSDEQKWLAFTCAAVKHPVLHEALQESLHLASVIDKDRIVELMHNYRESTHDISGATIPRRASTVTSWLRWIMGDINYLF